MKKTALRLLLLGATGIFSSAGNCSAADDMTLPKVLIERLRVGGDRETYILELLRNFNELSGADHVLTKDDADRRRMITEAMERSVSVQTFLRLDLDGDGRVTLAEAVNAFRRDSSDETYLKAADADHDGVVTIAEALQYARQQNHPMATAEGERMAALLALDPNEDGKLTFDEVYEVARKAFAHYDIDGNGILSDSEFVAVVADLKQYQPVRALGSDNCTAPPPSGNAEIIYVSTEQSGTLSTTSIVGQDDVTETSELNIEPGDRPIYIVAVSLETMLWRVTGHTERVERVVFSPGRGIGGVAGLSADKVIRPISTSCMRFLPESALATQPKWVSDNLKPMLGRPIERLLTKDGLRNASLPSDAVPLADWKPRRFVRPGGDDLPAEAAPADRDTYVFFRRLKPGGVVSINPAEVVPVGAQPYEVLPLEAGLLQLEEQGAIQNVKPGVYLITKAIPRFPAGLYGPHSVTFLLAKGVPVPKGNPGTSAVISGDGEDVQFYDVIRGLGTKPK